jgi:tetratricopeptide (TPR) repeat protein
MGYNLNEIFNDINLSIKGGNYDKALESLKLLKPLVDDRISKLPDDVEINDKDKRLNSFIVLVLNYAGFTIDCGSAINNVTVIDEGMEYAKKIFIKLKPTHYLYSTFVYNIANGYGELLQIRQHSMEQHYWVADNLTEEAKKLYRECLKKVSETDKFILPILTNYANLLNGRLGRIIESLHFYNRALSKDPNFAMALSNKGYVQSLFASVIGGEAQKVLLHEAYQNIRKAINIGLDVGPRNYFESIIENTIVKMYPAVVSLGEDIGCKIVLKKDKKFESFYKIFCISNDLFLNPISNSHQCPAALYDPLTIRRMIVQKEERNKFYNFSSYFNQIKQEYNFARFLIVQSFYKDSNIKFIDEGVILLDTLEYSAYSVFLEQAKTGFRIAYSILDKIAYVINDYFNLRMNKKTIYFNHLSPLWDKNILERFYPLQNPYVAALLDLATDFRNGHFQEISELRNTFEHRFRDVHIFAIPRRVTPEDEKISNIDMLTTKRFRELLLELLVVVKSAIFYLALMIDWEERLKSQKIGEDKIASIYLHEIPDNLKGE